MMPYFDIFPLNNCSKKELLYVGLIALQFYSFDFKKYVAFRVHFIRKLFYTNVLWILIRFVNKNMYFEG